MKNITLFVLFCLSAFWFLVAMMDSLLHNAAFYSDLGFAGKIATILFCICFGLLIIIGLVAPFAKYIITKIKSLWS